jgi:hypothetical protein
MGADRIIAPGREDETWTTCPRSSKAPEWDCMGAANRCTLARHAGTVWQVDDDLQPVPALAQVRHLGQDVCSVADCFGCGEQRGLGDPFH